jgi:hypothetical protein
VLIEFEPCSVDLPANHANKRKKREQGLSAALLFSNENYRRRLMRHASSSFFAPIRAFRGQKRKRGSKSHDVGPASSAGSRMESLMKTLGWITERVAPVVPGALLLGALLMTGCGGKPVEKPPQDVEQARKEHIKIMQRELGQGAGGANSQ